MRGTLANCPTVVQISGSSSTQFAVDDRAARKGSDVLRSIQRRNVESVDDLICGQREQRLQRVRVGASDTEFLSEYGTLFFGGGADGF